MPATNENRFSRADDFRFSTSFRHHKGNATSISKHSRKNAIVSLGVV
jgi:hypothetical protein